jgi:hypothetical protein
MSTRPTLPHQPVITNGDMSLASITSKPTILFMLTVGSYSFSWAGTSPVGTVQLEGSNDYALNADGTVQNAGTWTIFPVIYNGTTVSTVPVSGNTGNGIIDWTTGVYALRVTYIKTSGIGSLQVIFNGKVA